MLDLEDNAGLLACLDHQLDQIENDLGYASLAAEELQVPEIGDQIRSIRKRVSGIRVVIEVLAERISNSPSR